ncbi:HK97 family phage prohead protease [Nonomuraea sp. NPDC049400]|uniref:HK97 family phage prohead protease n=1 Tax=Nonomuraea sp. NPDC049400 TaxID=3364352 RepID=UPI00379FF628
MDTKSLRVEIKDADRGEVRAVFSTFNAIDSDNDVTLPGAFEDGAPVRISAYGHTSWQGALPVGKGVIRQTDEGAVLEGQFFMNTAHGRDTFATVKELSEAGLQEWSYGFDITNAEPGEWNGKSVRLLKKVKVHEVSPVLLGAGVNTRTLSAKSARPAASPARKRAMAPHDTPVVARSWDGPRTVAGIADDARPSELRSVFAWVDPDGDPEAKGSYKFPHHHGVGGPANIRACLAGIAALNGARGGASVPEGDREGVYKHLAAHLRDADREVPELRSAPGAPTRFSEELIEGMAVLSGLIDSASRVVALRAEKGKSLSKVNAEVLGWIADDLKRLERLLAVPAGDEEPEIDEEAKASVIAAGIARLNGF